MSWGRPSFTLLIDGGIFWYTSRLLRDGVARSSFVVFSVPLGAPPLAGVMADAAPLRRRRLRLASFALWLGFKSMMGEELVGVYTGGVTERAPGTCCPQQASGHLFHARAPEAQ